MTTATKYRWIPPGYEPVTLPDDAPAGCQVWRQPGKPSAIAYGGKRSNADWYIGFKSEERLQQYLADWLETLRQREARKAATKAERKAPHDVKVGDVFRCSWGYDQTNVDYWEVVTLKGKRQVEVRRIAADCETSGLDTGKCVPVPGRYIGEAETKLIQVWGGTPYFKAYSFASASRKVPLAEVAGVRVWAPDSWTSYA